MLRDAVLTCVVCETRSVFDAALAGLDREGERLCKPCACVEDSVAPAALRLSDPKGHSRTVAEMMGAPRPPPLRPQPRQQRTRFNALSLPQLLPTLRSRVDEV